jgi:mannose-1-phosphate guanylyltransferase / mannose-6-phosphate isomerase
VADKEKIYPVLLSGGAGTRLWPLSLEDSPKHLIQLIGSQTLFAQAALRATDRELFGPLTVIAGAPHRFMIAEQLREIGISDATIVLEPIGRNTTAAAAVAALVVTRNAPDAVLLVMPADHRIDEARFRRAISAAMPAARRGFLTLFGIKPVSPATGYGYIRTGAELSNAGGARLAAGFVEKPDRETAETYLQRGDFLWNSGIVLASAETLLDELRTCSPQIVECAKVALDRAERDADFLRLDAEAYSACPAISLDYALLERSARVAVVPADFAWRDIGSWSALWESAERDGEGNAVIGEAIIEATKDSYVRSEGPLVATFGIEGLIVVATKDAVLVAARDRDQDVRKVVEHLGKNRKDG